MRGVGRQGAWLELDGQEAEGRPRSPSRLALRCSRSKWVQPGVAGAPPLPEP